MKSRDNHIVRFDKETTLEGQRLIHYSMCPLKIRSIISMAGELLLFTMQ